MNDFIWWKKIHLIQFHAALLFPSGCTLLVYVDRDIPLGKKNNVWHEIENKSYCYNLQSAYKIGLNLNRLYLGHMLFRVVL